MQTLLADLFVRSLPLAGPGDTLGHGLPVGTKTQNYTSELLSRTTLRPKVFVFFNGWAHLFLILIFAWQVLQKSTFHDDYASDVEGLVMILF